MVENENFNLDDVLGAGKLMTRNAGHLMSRRSFTVLSLSAAMMATTAARAAQGMQVTESIVEVKTADGVCDASFAHPTTGSYPGVIVWGDIMGLTPAFRDLGKRLAAQGFSVLVPNPYYRKAKAPVFAAPLQESDRPMVMTYVGPIMAPGVLEKDTISHAAFLETQPSVNKAKKLGITGYCIGGGLAMRSAVALADRAGAGVSFHGGALITDPATVAKIKSRFYFAVSGDDAQKEPATMDKLKAAFDAAKTPVEIEVYSSTKHGWCVPGTPEYDMAEADRAFNKMVALYKQSIA